MTSMSFLLKSFIEITFSNIHSPLLDHLSHKGEVTCMSNHPCPCPCPLFPNFNFTFNCFKGPYITKTRLRTDSMDKIHLFNVGVVENRPPVPEGGFMVIHHYRPWLWKVLEDKVK